MNRPTEGRVLFAGEEITGLPRHEIARRGIARTFQNIRLFKELSVLENVLVGCHLRLGANLFEATLHLPGYRRREREARAFALDLLREVGLEANADELATSLPYGKQRRLEIVRALATRPTMLLLDEPAAGMNPQESIELMHFIQRIRDQFGLTILLIEHHMQVVMGVCHRIYVLEYGETIAAGRPGGDPERPQGHRGVPGSAVMLKVEQLSAHYGGIHALQGIDLEVPDGAIVSLIGANGAGKSTTLKSIVGLVKPSRRHRHLERREAHRPRRRRTSSPVACASSPRVATSSRTSRWTRT